jgi:hypothetical protein
VRLRPDCGANSCDTIVFRGGDIGRFDRHLCALHAEFAHNQTQCVSLTIITSPDVVNSMLIIQSRFSRP